MGMSSGELVAGILGNDRFQFDLCGDAANVAARMCTSAVAHEASEVGHASIHISTRAQQTIDRQQGELDLMVLSESKQDGSNLSVERRTKPISVLAGPSVVRQVLKGTAKLSLNLKNRGIVFVKGKGEMQTWVISGLRASSIVVTTVPKAQRLLGIVSDVQSPVKMSPGPGAAKAAVIGSELKQSEITPPEQNPTFRSLPSFFEYPSQEPPVPVPDVDGGQHALFPRVSKAEWGEVRQKGEGSIGTNADSTPPAAGQRNPFGATEAEMQLLLHPAQSFYRAYVRRESSALACEREFNRQIIEELLRSTREQWTMFSSILSITIGVSLGISPPESKGVSVLLVVTLIGFPSIFLVLFVLSVLDHVAHSRESVVSPTSTTKEYSRSSVVPSDPRNMPEHKTESITDSRIYRAVLVPMMMVGHLGTLMSFIMLAASCDRESVDSMLVGFVYALNVAFPLLPLPYTWSINVIALVSFSVVKLFIARANSCYFSKICCYVVGYLFPLVVTSAISRWRNEVQQRKVYSLQKSILVQQKQLQQEQLLTLQLLKQTLPDQMLNMLQRGLHPAVRASGTVLFADIVSFTSTTAAMTPLQITGILDQIFTAFDDLARLVDVVKIKTVGDCYVASAGVLSSVADHAEKMCFFACGMQIAITEINSLLNLAKPISIRIGIHGGEVVGGMIGRSRMGLDIWGRCVHEAQIMEEYGEPNRVNVSQNTFEDARRSRLLVFETRGRMSVKPAGGTKARIVSTANARYKRQEQNDMIEVLTDKVTDPLRALESDLLNPDLEEQRDSASSGRAHPHRLMRMWFIERQSQEYNGRELWDRYQAEQNDSFTNQNQLEGRQIPLAKHLSLELSNHSLKRLLQDMKKTNTSAPSVQRAPNSADTFPFSIRRSIHDTICKKSPYKNALQNRRPSDLQHNRQSLNDMLFVTRRSFALAAETLQEC